MHVPKFPGSAAARNGAFSRGKEYRTGAIPRLAKRWQELPCAELRLLLREIKTRIQVRGDRVTISRSKTRLRRWLGGAPNEEQRLDVDRAASPIDPNDDPDTDRLILIAPVGSRRVGAEMKLVVGDRPGPPAVDAGLIRILIRVDQIRRQLVQDPTLSLADIAERAGIVPSYATRIYRLSFLATDIVTAALGFA